MSILEDEQLQRVENKKYLKEIIHEYFKRRFTILEDQFQQKVNKDLIDNEDKEELKEFFKKEFQNLQNVYLYFPSNPDNVKPHFFDSISISDNAFTYNLDEILQSSFSINLLNKTFPDLKHILSNGYPFSYKNLITSLNVTTGKVFLKHNLKSLEGKPAFDSVENFEDVKYNYVFERNGFKDFKFLKNEFLSIVGQVGLTKKYSLILEVLRPKLKVDVTRYKEFVKGYCKDELREIKLSRLPDLTNNDYEKINKLKEALVKRHFN